MSLQHHYIVMALTVPKCVRIFSNTLIEKGASRVLRIAEGS